MYVAYMLSTDAAY